MKITRNKPITLANLDKLKCSDEYKSAMRQLRAPLLAAFDIYRSHVSYHTIVENEERHVAIVSWYKDLLDLKQSAIEDVPNEIKHYVQG